MPKQPDNVTDEMLIAQARTSLQAFFTDKTKRSSADIAEARIASSLLSTHARIRQAAGAADALSFMIARELSSDRTQLEQFFLAQLAGSCFLGRTIPQERSRPFEHSVDLVHFRPPMGQSIVVLCCAVPGCATLGAAPHS